MFNGQIAHLGGVDTVTAGGRAAALDMAQNGHTGIQIDGFLDPGGDVGSGAGAFGHNDHVMGEAVKAGLTDLFDDVPLKINGFLGNQDSRCADS